MSSIWKTHFTLLICKIKHYKNKRCTFWLCIILKITKSLSAIITATMRTNKPAQTQHKQKTIPLLLWLCDLCHVRAIICRELCFTPFWFITNVEKLFFKNWKLVWSGGMRITHHEPFRNIHQTVRSALSSCSFLYRMNALLKFNWHITASLNTTDFTLSITDRKKLLSLNA